MRNGRGIAKSRESASRHRVGIGASRPAVRTEALADAQSRHEIMTSLENKADGDAL